ncbi:MULTISPECIES: cytochrome C oxidase subunit IV family protein [Hymenobacter]|uniref:cytochrome C oxidase subunit IV family protein n=1 Tax=Hymenobacter TaxID=89966 RepID=UPI001244F3DE|nr:MULTISPECIES: cytochrome C oxidase subunit IV family protein [Hymenobacter]QKG53495.1 cytochrome C oxidase subunit IV family protein [Hymenobacter sp. BRD67]
MSAHAATEQSAFTGEIPKPNTAWIWKTFWILVVITAIEFAIAFSMTSPGLRTFRNSIFIVMTLLKAFFIVGEFMHLKHEVKSLIWTILIPTALLVWLVVALVTEGSYVGEVLSHMFSS